MKKILISAMLLATSLVGCGRSEAEHHCDTIRQDSIPTKTPNVQLSEQEYLALIEKAIDSGKFVDAKNYIDLLVTCFPRSEKKSFYLNLLPYVTTKAEELSLAADSAKKDSILRANADNLGIWEIQYFTDIFGEPTSEKYITTKAPIYGTFSSPATLKSDLRVKIVVASANSVAIKLFEYKGSNPVTGYNDRYNVIVQDSKGEWHELRASINHSDRLRFDDFSYKGERTDAEIFHQILMQGGRIRVKIQDADCSATAYNFTIPTADWYPNAYRKLIGYR